MIVGLVVVLCVGFGLPTFFVSLGKILSPFSFGPHVDEVDARLKKPKGRYRR